MGPASRSSWSCSPTAPLPDGLVDLEVSVSDLVGNQATETIQFTVDSAPLEVTIDSPLDRLLTKEGEIVVSGTVGQDATALDVNGVSAPVSGGGYSVTVPLREGLNMIVAAATAANGKTGSAAIEVTRDTTAPIVRISSPREQFVSFSSTGGSEGEFAIPNLRVPSGSMRVRVICDRGGQTIRGQTEFVLPVENGVIQLGDGNLPKC